MPTETLEELRERLLRQQGVQEMIQIRAYEIYQMRGGMPGGEAQDWFHAQGEVLAFLIATESAKADRQAEAEALTAAQAPTASPEEPETKKPRERRAVKPATTNASPARKPAAKRATTKTPAVPKTKSKKPGKQSKPAENDQ